MKRACIALLFAAFSGSGWGETLALTIHNDNGDPGEERSVWTEEYFVDDQGRLVRTHRVTQGAFVGDPEIKKDTVYHWESERVWWETGAPEAPVRYQIQMGGDSLDLSWENLRQKEYHGSRSIRPLAGEGVQWEDERFRYHYSKSTGYRQDLLERVKGTDGRGFEYKTEGSRLSEWTAGFENHRILLNKTPSRLVGTYVQLNENLDGWIATGEVWMSGAGLWHRDTRVLLVNAILLGESGFLPLAAAFVFEEKYLR